MTGRPWKLKLWTGGIHGTIAPTRSFASEAAAEAVAAEFRRLGWTATIRKVSRRSAGVRT